MIEGMKNKGCKRGGSGRVEIHPKVSSRYFMYILGLPDNDYWTKGDRKDTEENKYLRVHFAIQLRQP